MQTNNQHDLMRQATNVATEVVLESLEDREFIARTGRVQSWMDDPSNRLPVSCTVFVVQDSVEGEN